MSPAFSLPRRNPGFILAVGCLCVVGAGLAYRVHVSHRAMLAAEQQLRISRQEWVRLHQIKPAPTPETAAAIAADVREAEAALRELQTALHGGDAAQALRTAKAPTGPTDAYFDLVTYVEKMRRLAAERQVAVALNERFGFATYANGGPGLDLIPAVFRQRQILQYLLSELFMAGPQSLDRILRGTPAGRPQTGGRFESMDKDGFEPDPRWSARLPAQVGTEAFRITFTGETAVLRNWLNRLARFELPVVVRTVEVVPLTNPVAAHAVPQPSGSLVLTADEPAPPPLVPRRPVRFTVTLEYLDLLQPQEGGDR